ncbi:MAG: hypothetical protein ACFFB2_09820 [Promethearchaeota archaeon]
MNVKEFQSKKRSVDLPIDLLARIETRVSNSKEFNSINEYVEYVLSGVLDIIEEQFPYNSKRVQARSSSSLNVDEKEQIKKRLENLGYM